MRAVPCPYPDDLPLLCKEGQGREKLGTLPHFPSGARSRSRLRLRASLSLDLNLPGEGRSGEGISMARYEHLPIYNTAMDLAVCVHVEQGLYQHPPSDTFSKLGAVLFQSSGR